MKIKKFTLVFLMIGLLLFTGCFNESKKYTELEVGESIKLTTELNNPIWSSNNEAVAIVDESGIVKAVGSGEAIITAKLNNQKSEITIKVSSGEEKLTPQLKITGKQTVKKGETITIVPFVENTNEAVVFSYSINDEAIATVSNDGVITGVSNGIATIAVKAKFGSQTIVKDYVIFVTDDEEKTLVNIIQNIQYIVNGDADLTKLSESIENIVETYKDSIMGVTNYQYVRYGFSTLLEKAGVGTGFIYKKEAVNIETNKYYVLTNYHVIKDNDLVRLYFGYEDVEVDCEVVKYDESLDLAMLTFSSNKEYNCLSFENNDNVKAGDFAIAIGNPKGYDYFGSVSFGIVSYNNRKVSGETSTFVQHDVAINPGNSGGPLINMDGKVIGVNTLKITTEDVDNLGFSIDMNTLNKFLND